MAVYTAIDDAGSFFNTVLYTGTGGVQTISGVGFEPGLTWCKDRTNSYDQVWFDQARGATERITSNTTAAESTQVNDLTAWNSDGFVVGSGSNINVNTNLFVGWNWKAGTTSGLSGGTITPSAYSFNTTSGFSILKYTGTGSNATIPHGLAVAPTFVIVKQLNTTASWYVGCPMIGWADELNLNGTGAEANSPTTWNSTAPTTSVISVGTASYVNDSGGTYVAYCFAPIKGYSSFGKYSGNGNADGPFVYTGFRPAFLILRRTDSGGDWFLWDDKRGTYNVNTPCLAPNAVTAETSRGIPDFLSNGFKLRDTNVDANASGGEYIYVAFAENPFVNSSGVPGNAR